MAAPVVSKGLKPMQQPRTLRLCASTGPTTFKQYHKLLLTTMNLPENETAAAPAPGNGSHGPVLASSPASAAPHPVAGAVACPVASEAPVPGSGFSATPFSVSASASEGGLLTPEQLALRLNVSRRCLGNWTRDRIIPMVKIGRVCRFDLPQVMAALEKHVQAAVTR
jgi:excisionase family DNA binding protein